MRAAGGNGQEIKAGAPVEVEGLLLREDTPYCQDVVIDVR